jgi:hypothetical protein
MLRVPRSLIMKFALIAVGLLAIIGQVPPAFGRAGGIHAEDPWNPQHINGLPPEIRNVYVRRPGERATAGDAVSLGAA